ncbi:hypothetical protein [Streptomyces orinoci]|uniref:Uncharacterized protein n=1 Tax=Streptomyces orinoci TaxID=67339 RepID=A0ABV3K4W3_STRON|nr:hypothetical protein [Streptomyces orinoci]
MTELTATEPDGPPAAARSKDQVDRVVSFAQRCNAADGEASGGKPAQIGQDLGWPL